jgi:UDP:flavonoid glycosyltransferase YjiC (YdhE family)
MSLISDDSPLHVLLIPTGTPGDVQPFLDIGIGLRQRGHRATLIAHAPFHDRALQVGLEFAELGTSDDYDLLLNDRNLWNPAKAHRVFAKKLVLPTLRRTYDLIKERYEPGKTVVAAQTMAMGARIAQDKFGVPVATLHRQPTFMRSMRDTSQAPYMFLPRWLPAPMKWAQFRIMDMFMDHPYLPAVNALRAELGLPPVKRWANHWIHSPDGVVAMWPDWFAPPQRDWPANTIMVGFNAHEHAEDQPSETIRAFVESGDPPIVFTVGSGMRHGAEFYAASAQACARMGRRGVLATRLASQVPTDLPPGVIYTKYAPFSWLLPRAAAIVHHAGIGTVAQSLASGVPQLSVPGLVFDTVDTSKRLQHIGVGRSLPIHKYTPQSAAAVLSELLGDPKIATACKEYARRVQANDAIAATCNAIESIAKMRSPNLSPPAES